MTGSDPVARLDSIARAPVDAGEVIGISVAVVRGDSSVYTAAHGLSDQEAAVPMTPANPLRLASVAKMMTAALALRLETAGVVSLDAPLGELIPEVGGAVGPDVTLRAVLGHTSGLPDYLEDYFASEESFYATGQPLAESFVFRYVAQVPSRFPPGRHWAYSNTGFYLAAVALERAAGMGWDRLIRESLAGPLGLESLRTCDEYIRQEDLRGYALEEGAARESPMYVEPGVKGDGGLAMTAADLAAFARGLEQTDYLGPGGFARLSTPTRLENGTEVDYGIGARLGSSGGSRGGRRMWGHTGALESYVGTLLRFPEDDVTVAVVHNTVNARVGALALAGQLAEVALGLAPTDMTPAPAPFDPTIYTGEYVSWGESSKAYGTRISPTEEGLVRTWLHAPEKGVALVPLGSHEFGRGAGPRDRFRFHMSGGAAVAYSVYSAGLFAGHHWRAE